MTTYPIVSLIVDTEHDSTQPVKDVELRCYEITDPETGEVEYAPVEE